MKPLSKPQQALLNKLLDGHRLYAMHSRSRPSRFFISKPGSDGLTKVNPVTASALVKSGRVHAVSISTRSAEYEAAQGM